MTTMTEIHPGTRVAVGNIVGEIAAIRIVERGLYILNIRQDSGALFAVKVRQSGDELAPSEQPPVDIAAAATLARRVLARKEPRMPVAAVTDMLAAALVALADGPTPALSVEGAE